MISAIKERFPGYHVEPLNKGWSSDRKYILINNQVKYTLRVSNGKTLTQQKSEFDTIHLIGNKDRLIRPVECGRLNVEHTYIMYSYLEGEDLKSALSSLKPSELYDLGVQAGCILNDIHEISGDNNYNFEQYYNHKITNRISEYRESGHFIPELDPFIHYMEEHRHLLKNRPTVLQHGDYHMGNMVVRDNTVFIIDFNRYSFGDPFEEFDRMTMNSSFSREFAKGLLNGYFKGVPPHEFWPILKLYVLTNAVGSIPWALQHSPESLGFVHDIIHATIRDYEDLSSPLPNWYREMLRI